MKRKAMDINGPQVDERITPFKVAMDTVVHQLNECIDYFLFAFGQFKNPQMFRLEVFNIIDISSGTAFRLLHNDRTGVESWFNDKVRIDFAMLHSEAYSDCSNTKKMYDNVAERLRKLQNAERKRDYQRCLEHVALDEITTILPEIKGLVSTFL